MSSSLEPIAKRSSQASTPPGLYTVYGLVVESEIDMPELLPAPTRAAADIRVSFGRVPETIEGPIAQKKWCQASKREFLMNIEGVARYHVQDGQQITVELDRDTDKTIRASDVRLWLLGSAFGALLHQRRLLPLHVSAIKAPSGVWAFTGASGEGKSTLAGFLFKRFGWKLVSDDVSVIEADHSRAMVHPGPQKLKLWADALDHLDFPDYLKARDLSNTRKFQIYLSGNDDYKPEPLHGLVLLESLPSGAGPSVERLRGTKAFSACMTSIYRPYMDTWFKPPEYRMSELTQLCEQVAIYRFGRPRSLNGMEQNLAPLLELLFGRES